jgi:hypothetical protein
METNNSAVPYERSAILFSFFQASGDTFHGHKISDHPGYAIRTELQSPVV